MTHATQMGADPGLHECPLMPNYGAPSIMFVRGSGTELWDREGKRYLDFVGGLAVQMIVSRPGEQLAGQIPILYAN